MIKLTDDLINDLSKKAKEAARGRTNYNFHKSYDDAIQRMLNAAEPGTYIRPHKHENPDKTEIFIILRGSVVMVEFDDSGRPIDHVILDPQKGAKAVEVAPRKWHSFITLKTGSVLYEVKDGPYTQMTDKNFAPWAPAEGTKEALEFNERILRKLDILK